jgi:hypothetical protein
MQRYITIFICAGSGKQVDLPVHQTWHSSTVTHAQEVLLVLPGYVVAFMNDFTSRPGFNTDLYPRGVEQ